MIITKIYQTPIGELLLADDGEGLCGAWFDGSKYYAPLPEERMAGESETLALAARWLDEYFGGRIPAAAPPLSLHGSAFREAVWRLLLEIPFGETVTYGELAARLAIRTGGKKPSAQAIGGAVGHNPVSLIVPCHRVIGADGGLTGYAGGLWRKEYLLGLERTT